VADPTPPAAPFDQAAHTFRESMLPRADGNDYANFRFQPYWHGWALVEAFEAGRQAGKAEERAACAKVAAQYEPSAADYARADRGEASAWDIAAAGIATAIYRRT
jgi:hypothetical protein